MDLKKHYVNGEWVTPISTVEFPVLNPATEQQIGTIILGNDADVDRAIAAAVAAFEQFSKTTKTERLDLLHALMTETKARFDDLAEAMSQKWAHP